MSGATEQTNGRASGPVLQSVFLVVLDHSAQKETPETYFGKDVGIAITIAFGESLHHSIDLLSFARQTEAPQELTESLEKMGEGKRLMTTIH